MKGLDSAKDCSNVTWLTYFPISILANMERSHQLLQNEVHSSPVLQGVQLLL
jgi:hypothetical protein